MAQTAREAIAALMALGDAVDAIRAFKDGLKGEDETPQAKPAAHKPATVAPTARASCSAKIETPPGSRLTSCQKCFRANDIDIELEWAKGRDQIRATADWLASTSGRRGRWSPARSMARRTARR